MGPARPDDLTGPTVAVVLAAGAGRRFDGEHHKLLAPLRTGVTIVGVAIQNALDAGIGPVVVVTGAVEIPIPVGAVERHNPHWERGQASSLRCGLDAARELGATAAVVGLGDQPGVSAAAWRAVATQLGPICVATYDGVRGNPVKLAAEVWPLLPTTGDAGARILMRQRPDLVHEVPCTGSPVDIDTLEDLRRWQSN